MAEFLVIREVTEGIRTYSCPFTRMGVMPIGGRSTAVRLSDNKSVLVVASTPMTDATRASVDELGTVKYLIAPDAEHYLFLKDWAAVYPNARICGVERHISCAGVPIAGVWGTDSNPLGDDPVVNADFASEFVSGHINKEVALLHRPSGTLIQADLLFNLPANEQYSAPGAGKPTGGLIRYIFDPASLNPYSSKFQNMVYNQLARDKKQVAHSAQVIASWEFDRIIPCHGDVIETGGKEAWRSSFKKFFDDIAAGKFEKYVPNASTTSAPTAESGEKAPLVAVTPAAEGATTPKIPSAAPDVAPAPGAAPTAA